MKTIAIVDYGMSNLSSVSNALDFLGIQNRISSDANDIVMSDAVILPGVGAFPDAMRSIKNLNLLEILKEQATKKPFLGICLGMQLLFERGFENSEVEGLSLIRGEVRKMKTSLKLPQIGWNSLKIKNQNALTRGIHDGDYVYFVHSYAGFCENSEDICAVTDYEDEVLAVCAKGTIYGCQFHPEKSGEIGLSMLKNFGELL